jgi:hypothetical protein
MLSAPFGFEGFQGAAGSTLLAIERAVNIIKPRGALSRMAAILCWASPLSGMAITLPSAAVKAPSQATKVVWLGFAESR